MSFSSHKYWNDRYDKGGNSGSGSYNEYAQFKANIINDFILNNEDCKTYLELGCGDGNQQSLINYPSYIGFDISKYIIESNKAKYQKINRNFIYEENALVKADVTLSLDVIYHLVEDEIYLNYMNKLFSLANKFVFIYSTNREGKQFSHYRDRKFTDAINLDWGFELINEIKNTTQSSCNFYIYKKK